MKDYLVHPYRLAFAQGGLYLLAYVPEYKDVRTFAVDRIASVSLEKQTFTPTQAVGDDVFANSLGVNTGPAERVEIEFDARVAPYVRARVWHPSQAARGHRRMAACPEVERVPRMGSAKLDSQLGPVRACGLAATTGEGDPRRSRGSRREIPMKSSSVASGFFGARSSLSLLFLGGPSLLRFYTDWLWFGEVGYQQVFSTMLRSQGTLFTITFVVARSGWSRI